jgi:hypothetical protein
MGMGGGEEWGIASLRDIRRGGRYDALVRGKET